MSLDGLRAWIGEVERKLAARTRVVLVLVAIAIGGAGAGIYLALEAGDDAATKDDVQRVADQFQAQIESTGAATTGNPDPRVTQLETELDALEARVEGLRGEGKTAPNGGTSEGGGASAEGGVGAPNGGASAAKLKELVEKAQDKSK
jgi:hypothetical protein